MDAYLAESRTLVLDEIRRIIPRTRRPGHTLYDMMLDYPLREAKALRPALTIASCRALGGNLESVLRTAAALELYHNAFLIHDDIEDGSHLRRGKPTLHKKHGVPIAVNVGDAMLALSLQPLLDNIGVLGLGKSLRVLQLVARMARESAEGQATELEWIRDARWDLADRDYIRMVYQKTTWYTFLTPVLIGAISAQLPQRQTWQLQRFATLLGVAFQIMDDVLNLDADEGAYGKEIGGDLQEGKRTLILLHALRHATPRERARAIEALERPREEKSETDVAGLLALVRAHDSLGFARKAAIDRAERAAAVLTGAGVWMPDSTHRAFLHELTRYVIRRER